MTRQADAPTKYLALLRGVNVGGKGRVEMDRLKETFERLGMGSVRTYINSGNVVFTAGTERRDQLATILEKGIERDFGFSVKVLIRDFPQIQQVTTALQGHWLNGPDMKCDVMFLWEEVDTPGVLENLRFDPDLEDVLYVPGAVIWRVDRKHLGKSRMTRMIGTDLYKQMTIRNCNTVRKLATIMADIG